MANTARNFDSLTYANQLRKAGVPEEQANLQAQALFTVVEEQMLSKQDLERVELKLSSDIEKLDAKLSHDIEKVEAKLSAEMQDLRRDVKESELRLFVRLMTGMTIVGAILKFLPNFHL